jgi:3-methyladenine DNA glycosylase/8-oxoguanine DNA glycosylase
MSTRTEVERETAFALEPLGDFSLQAAARFCGFTPASHAGLDTQGHLHMAFPVEGSWSTAGVCVRAQDGRLVAHEATDGDLRRISEAWRPYRTWITFLLRQEPERGHQNSDFSSG